MGLEIWYSLLNGSCRLPFAARKRAFRWNTSVMWPIQSLKQTVWTANNDNVNEVDMYLPYEKPSLLHYDIPTVCRLHWYDKSDLSLGCLVTLQLTSIPIDFSEIGCSTLAFISSICSTIQAILGQCGIYVCSTCSHSCLKEMTWNDCASWPNWLPWRFVVSQFPATFWLRKHFTTVHLAQPDQKLMW